MCRHLRHGQVLRRGRGGRIVVVSSALETSVGLAAELALAGALPQLELACAASARSPCSSATSRDHLPRNSGQAAVPGPPPVPDSRLLERYALRDSDWVRWWRERTLRTHARLRALLGL